MPEPGSILYLQEDGTEELYLKACFKYGNANHWAKTCLSPQLLKRPCYNCEQGEQCRINCPTLPRQVS